MFVRALSILILMYSVAIVSAQTGTNPKSANKKKDPSPAGYKKDNLHGFTLYISDEAMANDKASKLERTPLEALERELILMEKVVPADKMKSLRNVPIWVEWDEKTSMGNGRGGTALAVFYGGHQSGLLSEKNTIKGEAITLLSLKTLASEHQPKTDSNRCVTLHEMAHAFHHFVVGNQNPMVITAYKTAMERKLYDPKMYAATNDHEYFAELTCAYLDQLHYPPRNRDELKKHDPKGFEVMERFWGKIIEKKDSTATKSIKLPSPDGGGQYTLKASLDDVRFTGEVSGKLPSKGYWKDHPFMIIIWGPQGTASQIAIAKAQSWYSELEDFGAIFVGASNNLDADSIKEFAKLRGVTFAMVERVQMPLPERFRLPHAILFDHAGKLVFRGDPLDAEKYLRLSVAKSILALTGKDEFKSRQAKSVVELLETAQPMSAVLSKIVGTISLADGEAATELKLLQEAMTTGARTILEQSQSRMQDEPVKAYFDLERISMNYKGTPVAKKANELLPKLRTNARVQTELRARPSLEALKKLDTQLSGKDLSFDPKLPKFQLENSQLLKQFGDSVERMKKNYPGTKATEEAIQLAQRWAIQIQ